MVVAIMLLLFAVLIGCVVVITEAVDGKVGGREAYAAVLLGVVVIMLMYAASGL